MVQLNVRTRTGCRLVCAILAVSASAIANAGTPAATVCPPTYAINPGVADVAWWGGLGLNVYWANSFTIERGAETIVAVDVCLKCWSGPSEKFLPPGHPFQVALLREATPGAPIEEMELVALADAVVESLPPGDFQRVALAPTIAGDSGAAFAVAVITTTPTEPTGPGIPNGPFNDPTTHYYPACYDSDVPEPGHAWLGLWEPGRGGNPVLLLHWLGITESPGSFLIRGVALDDEVIGDLNCDSIVNGADLGLLLSNWGAAGIGDLNDDGTVDGADLGILLAHWH